MAWFVYIVECKDKKFYTGITNDLDRRIKEHNGGYGCAFTRTRTPVRLLHKEQFLSKIDALKREAAIKGLTRVKKFALTQSPSA